MRPVSTTKDVLGLGDAAKVDDTLHSIVPLIEAVDNVAVE